MKNLILALLLTTLTSTAHAQKVERNVLGSLKCTATTFRAGLEPHPENSGMLWALIVKKDGKVYAEQFGGHLFIAGYYGIFKGENLVETPYQRPVKYKNHYRFQNFDAIYTAGAEQNMWGEFIINKAVDNSRETQNFSTDGHYVFKAGDHLGGTIDYQCVSDL